METLDIKRKDAAEDIGFVTKIDPWTVLSDYYGDEFKEYRRKWNAVSNFELELDFPLQIDFELNDNCNYACPMCTFSIVAKKKANYFPTEKYKSIVSEGVKRGLAAIDFSFVNEPLMRSDLPELIRYARDQGVLDLAFNTNAQLLTKAKAEALLTSGLTRIQFSLDAHNAETFAEVRKGGNYDKVVKNILQFLELKQSMNVKGLMTAVSFVKMSVNEDQWEPFVEFWRDKVDYIILREYLIPVGPESDFYDDRKKYFASSQHHAQEFKCNKPWQRVVIQADGTVLPCCTFFAPQLPMGNINEQSLDEIWNSPKMKFLREIHKCGNYHKNKVCKACAEGSTVEAVI